MKTESMLSGIALVMLLLGSTAPLAYAETSENWEKVVFHLDEVRNARWALMLVGSYLDDRPDAQIVVVAYGPGIDFLLEDAEDARGNPYDPAVLNMVERGVEFRVCAETLAARDIAREDVLDAAVVVPSGISEIARLQIREGYAYLKP